MAKELVLTVKNLTKKFDKFTAVENVSFEIEKGETVGLLGPNGAGKTTTIMMLLGIIKPTKGDINIFNLDLQKNREKILKKINFASASSVFPGRLTVFENLYIFSQLYEVKNPREKIEKLLREFELVDFKNTFTYSLSSGQMTRLSLCKSLLNNPEVLFLDEPTASLDPDIAKKVRDFLSRAKNNGNLSMLYTSHNMAEITQMCDRVIFLNHGRIVASDTPLNLTKLIEDSFLILTFDAPLAKTKRICQKYNLKFKIPQLNTLEIKLREKEIGKTLTRLAKGGVEITDVMIERPNLEDVFLKIAGRK